MYTTRGRFVITFSVGGGELFERIVDDDFELKETDCVRFMKQICDGIAYMHVKSIVHLDLKPENVMCVSKHSNQVNYHNLFLGYNSLKFILFYNLQCVNEKLFRVKWYNFIESRILGPVAADDVSHHIFESMPPQVSSMR